MYGKVTKKFILQERSYLALAEKLRYLLEHREMFLQLSVENLESIQTWDWKLKVQSFSEWFQGKTKQIN